MNLKSLDVKTTNNELFTGKESAQLAALIYKRFGRSVPLAAFKWRQMLGNNISNEQFAELAKAGE